MIEQARELIQKYIDTLEQIKADVNNDLVVMVNQLKKCNSNIVVSGVGKSAIIAKKISSTMNSLGIKSFYIHPTEALHGDLGQIHDDDFVLVLSKSGETPEIITFMHYVRQRSNLLFSITKDSDNTINKLSDYQYKIRLGDEACHMNLAPTTSAAAFMVIGDVISVLLSQGKGFTAAQYAETHPGGNLGARLNLKVKDIMRVSNELPLIHESDNLLECILEMTSKRLGMVNILDDSEVFTGIITDYDLRRFFEEFQGQTKLNEISILNIINKKPTIIKDDILVIDALKLMRKKSISVLPVIENNHLIGITNIHDILKNGITIE